MYFVYHKNRLHLIAGQPRSLSMLFTQPLWLAGANIRKTHCYAKRSLTALENTIIRLRLQSAPL